MHAHRVKSDTVGLQKNTRLGLSLLAITIAGSLLLALSLDPIAQPLGYHAFGDNRRLFGVDNFWNFVSNLPFLVFGLSGLVYTLRARPKGARRSWMVFFAALALVSVGSGWYHLAPDNTRLVWDRLPIAVALVALFVAMLAEHVGLAQERWLIPGVLLGAATVVYWHYTDDLRVYLWVQSFTLIGVLIFLLLFQPNYPARGWLLAALVLFMLAKIVEYYDVGIFSVTGGLVGGHAIKHFLAGFAPLAVQIMLMRREPGGQLGDEA